MGHLLYANNAASVSIPPLASRTRRPVGGARPALGGEARAPAHSRARRAPRARALTGARPRQIRELEEALRAAAARAADAGARAGAPGADRPEVGLARFDSPRNLCRGRPRRSRLPRTACDPPRRAARKSSQLRNVLSAC
jgi:hypothetical protein